MKSPGEAKQKKPSATQIKRKMQAFAKKMRRPNEPAQPEAAVVEWAESNFRARRSAADLWKAYLAEDPISFDATVKRVKPGSTEIKMLIDFAYHARSPRIASELGAASAKKRYEPIREAICADWIAAREKGGDKSKPQFARDWMHQKGWTDLDKPPVSERRLYEWLLKIKP
ncbi:hypothetical protein [Lysobacter sp. A3-1-A15]|uniref:hypothetical protein n=1 Tax=Novilysobacter viscosus TaxID=3098602 RepID=UPI002ED992DE